MFNSTTLDSTIFGRYSSDVAAKSAIGIGTPKVNNEHIRALCGFFVLSALSHLSMVGWVGAPQGAPGSLLTGSSNPAQFTTSQSLEPLGGEFKKLNNEAAIMATTPTEVASSVSVEQGSAVTTSLDIAFSFNRSHDRIIKAIETLECSPEFAGQNFTLSEYIDVSGRKSPCYLITRDGFIFLAMSFAGGLNRKQSALAAIDSETLGRYSSDVAAKSAIGISLPKVKRAHNRAQSGFFMRDALSHLSMVGWAGAPQGAPGSLLTGKANPAQFTTSQISLCSGEFKKLKREAAIMATTPTEVASSVSVEQGSAVTTSLDIAFSFNRSHDRIIKAIETLECSPEFFIENFKAIRQTIVDGQSLVAYQITRNGFSLLSSCFNGKRATPIKEAYLAAFTSAASNNGDCDVTLACRDLHTAEWYMRTAENILTNGFAVVLPLHAQGRVDHLQAQLGNAITCITMAKRSLGGDQ